MAKPKRQGTSPWVSVGCGCCLLVLLIIGAIMAAGMFGAAAFKGYIDDMKDPTARGVKAAEILGVDELPEGYTAHVYLRVPWLFEMVVASDSEPVEFEDDDFELESDAVGRHLLVFFSIPQSDMDHDDLEDMLRGKRTSEGVKTDIDLEFEVDEELSRGSFELGDQELSYVGYRGELELDDGDVEGIYSQVLVDCPRSDRTRAFIWFQRADSDAESNGHDGTPADEETLRRFMSHFDVCDS